MPFTLFHMGAGLLGKGLAPKHQSFIFFGATQVAIDLEPAVKMAIDYQGSWHSITHDLFGMVLTVTLCALLWGWAQKKSWWWKRLPVLSRTTLALTAAWGMVSHWLLDSMSHADMPYSTAHWFGIEDAQGTGLLMGIVGLAILGLRPVARKLVGALTAFGSNGRTTPR
jgi:hypothetical protein